MKSRHLSLFFLCKIEINESHSSDRVLLKVNQVKHVVRSHRRKELRSVSYSFFFSLSEILHAMPGHCAGYVSSRGAAVAIALVSLSSPHTPSPGLSFQTGLLADSGQATAMAMHCLCTTPASLLSSQPPNKWPEPAGFRPTQLQEVANPSHVAFHKGLLCLLSPQHGRNRGWQE